MMQNKMKTFIVLIMFIISLFFNLSLKAEVDSTVVVYVYEIKDEIGKAAWRTTQKAIFEANEKKVDYIILHINTYGGRVDLADSIRTKILNNRIPVLAFINNQAISAGALISISCDSIYMRPGGSIGAATVVSQTGEVVPDKYQSFMRSTMRATAESHGKDTIISGNDTTIVWHRTQESQNRWLIPKLVCQELAIRGRF
jgi:membrane-bound serine protease (ClpP class)